MQALWHRADNGR